ncbi:hypothetical protein C8R46DRAFT_1035477 [Mycena filopes]|nr:hypothetical protein C8R46DRAFT_1035477 [Mycena filopes]
MSSNPAHYNVNDVLRFENYADALRNFGAGVGPFPGPTPTGYREFFLIRHRYAPVPEDFDKLIAGQDQRKAGPAAPATAVAHDVMMSAPGLRAMLESQQKMFDSALAISQKNLAFKGRPDRRPARQHRGYQRGGRAYRGNNFGRGHLVDRLGGPSDVGGWRQRSRHNRNGENRYTPSDVASDVATAGGLTDNEEDVEVITAEDIPEEGELSDQEEDNGFNMAQ